MNINILLLAEIFLTAANVASLAVFGLDKYRSKRGGWRISESKLLLAAFVAPFGAYAGMLLFRHKTRKLKFLLVPVFLVAQVVLAGYFLNWWP